VSENLTILYRPVGPKELELIAASGYREFPPRLSDQPIFYPVLNEEYARQIARDWNVKDSGAGYVTRCAVRAAFASRYPAKTVGSSIHKELWVPAEDLAEFNRNIVGQIEVIAEFLATTAKPILFYRVSEPYGEFSNFSPHPIRLQKRVWPTTEHYFQAQKFAGTSHEDTIRQAKSPMIAARLGRSRSFPLRSDWESVKDDIMRDALWAKFTQHPQLQSLLLSTGDAELVEHTRNDSYWGDGGDGTGRNRLGQLLMEVRTRLRRCYQTADTL
jgi:ribA/ribD-fused uncharacterized protein